MIRIGAGVDDVSNRPRRELLDRRDDRVGPRRRPGIDDHHAIVSDLDADVAAGAGDHVEVRAQLEHFEIAGRSDATLGALRDTPQPSRLGEERAHADEQDRRRREASEVASLSRRGRHGAQS